MDLVGHDRTSIIAEEEDRISKLPDNIIHHILSFLDMKYAVQTCKLSRRWKCIWKSMPCLNLHIHTFGDMSRFGKFVKCVLSHRKDRGQVSTVNFAFTGNPDTSVVNNFVKYVYSHSVKEMTLILFGKNTRPFAQSVFRSDTLKHLTIRFGNDYGVARRITNLVWDFPALETLNLSRMLFGEDEDKIVNLFSTCVNLKDLTLHHCSMSHLDFFIVSAPNLLNLSITGDFRFPKVFNVVTPRLENLTASAISGFGSLRLFTEGFNFLEKVNLSSSCNYNMKRYILPLLKLFQKLRTAKFLILDTWIIQVLSLCLDKFSHLPCPFNNLRCLKIDTGTLSSSIYESDRIAKMAPQVRNYLLENSPNATFIMDLPQVPPTGLKRPMQEVNNETMVNKMAMLDVPTVEPSSASNPSLSDALNLLLLKVPHQISRQQVCNDVKKIANLEVPPMRLKRPMQSMHNDTMANKMAKLDVPTTPIPSSSNVPRRISVWEVLYDATRANLEAKIQMQDEVMAKQQAMFEAKIQMQDEVMAKQKAMFEAKIQMADEVFAEKKARFETRTRMQDEVMAKQKAMLEAKIHMQDEVVAKEKEMLETKIQMQDEVIAKQKATFEAKAHMQDEIISKQKAMFETKIEMQNEGIAEQKIKVQMQDDVIANQKAMFDAKVQMLEAAKSQHEELMSHIIKWKIAELKVQVESGNPDYNIIRSIRGDIKSVIGLIPESLKLVMKAQFSFQYVEMKSMFFTRINATEWAKIESELASNI